MCWKNYSCFLSIFENVSLSFLCYSKPIDFESVLAWKNLNSIFNLIFEKIFNYVIFLIYTVLEIKTWLHFNLPFYVHVFLLNYLSPELKFCTLSFREDWRYYCCATQKDPCLREYTSNILLDLLIFLKYMQLHILVIKYKLLRPEDMW